MDTSLSKRSTFTFQFGIINRFVTMFQWSFYTSEVRQFTFWVSAKIFSLTVIIIYYIFLSFWIITYIRLFINNWRMIQVFLWQNGKDLLYQVRDLFQGSKPGILCMCICQFLVVFRTSYSFIGPHHLRKSNPQVFFLVSNSLHTFLLPSISRSGPCGPCTHHFLNCCLVQTQERNVVSHPLPQRTTVLV